MKSRLPDYTFKEGEWYWYKGEWYRSGCQMTRDEGSLTVEEAKKLGLEPPKEKVKGWFVKMIGRTAYSHYAGPYKSKEEAKALWTETHDKYFSYMQECDPPEE